MEKRQLKDENISKNMVQVQGLSYQYPDGRLALKDISFSLAAGEKVAVLGANGAGKSTLLLHLNGILSGTGQVTVSGQVLNQKTLPQIRAAVGMIFQNPDDQLFSPTVWEDVAYGPHYQGLARAEIEDRVAEALTAVHLQDFEQRSPHHLSGGEKKRAAIASVLSMRPRVLVLDEPTAGLDPRGRRELLELLGGLPQTLLVATHDLDFARRLATRALVLDGGKLVADRPLEKLLDDEDFLYQYGLS
ncbi:MAG TPA: ABC transporter ATP-binding protein [Anaerolineaceae bacterium]|nr:ABC transporter ATP-binding protein [Anaerolineaceae bacterium]HPN50477.1 ABC transporter ATP-binding protein [Anaerolineaceae bacterium]